MFKENKKEFQFLIVFFVILIIGGCSNETKYVTVLGEYKNLKYEKYNIEVSESEIEEEIKGELAAYIEYEKVNDAIKSNDIVVMDLSMYNENKEKIYNQEYEYIVDGTDIGLDAELIGKGKGDIIEYFPQEIAKELGDNNKNCFIKIIQIDREKPLVLTDEFVQRISKMSTVKEYKQYIKDTVYNIKEEMVKDEIMENLQ